MGGGDTTMLDARTFDSIFQCESITPFGTPTQSHESRVVACGRISVHRSQSDPVMRCSSVARSTGEQPKQASGVDRPVVPEV